MQLGLDFFGEQRAAIDAFSPTQSSPDSMVLRPYQAAAVAGIDKQLADSRSTLVVMPTGTGKTVVFSHVAKRAKGRVLITAHRDELLGQARRRVAADTGELVGLEQAQFFAESERIVVASIQTLSQPDRLARWPRDSFSTVIIDEAHHAPSPTYRRVVDHFDAAKVIGVTATPDRADEKAMGTVFETVAFVYEIQDAISDQWLCPIRVRVVKVDSIDLSNVHTVAGDLNQGELDAAMAVEEAMHGVAKATLDESGQRKTLVFTTSVENVHRLTEILNRYRPGCANCVDGETPIDTRRARLRGFESGQFQYLVNCGIATEGYDCPTISCIAMARPTKSRSLFAQMVGRGLRIHPAKPDGCMVLEFTGNNGRHSLASSVDILGGRFTEEEVERAKKIASDNPGMRADVALAMAHEEAEKEKQRELAKRARIKANVHYSTHEINPFDVLHIRGKEDDWSDRFGGAVPTEKQLAALEKFGVDIPKNCTKQQASRLLDSCFKRASLHLARYKQVKLLEKYGIPALNVTMDKASQLIETVKRNNWRTPPRQQIDAILKRERQAGEDE